MEMDKIYFVQETKISYKNGKRFKLELKCSEDTAEFVRNHTEVKDFIDHHEMFYGIYLNNANEVSGIMKIGDGGLTSVSVDIKRLFQGALLHNATQLIIVHNHPSGSTKQSQQDKDITKKVNEAGKILGIHLVDSLIVTRDNHSSLIYDIL